MTGLMYSKETKISLYVATALTLALGYADLWRGGITVSALLLAIAYCVCIPLAIVASFPSNHTASPNPRSLPPYGIAAIVSVAVLALYVITMAPSTAMWDTSEYIAAAYTFGLPHPPGNPFFVIVGRVFSILPIAPTVAQRINLLAAICSAASAGLWFLVTEQVLRGWVTQRWIRLAVAITAAILGATAYTVWNQSVVNEKVYTVSLTGIALVSWLAVRWSVDPDAPSANGLLVLIAYLCGLGYANHMAGMLPAPAIALAVLLRKPATIVKWRLLLVCAVALFVGITPFATQPIRAAHFPAMNEGEPTACRTKLELSCTMSKGTYSAFMYNFNRGQYGKPALGDRQASFGEQLGMWWMYFRWQWLRDPDAHAPFVQSLFAALFFVFGLVGAWTHYRRDRRTFWYFGALMFTMTLLLIFYLNFKLGASQDIASPNEHEVRDRDYFFLWSFSAWGVWAALGLLAAWESIAELLGTVTRASGKTMVTEPAKQSWLRSSPLLAVAIVPVFANWPYASRAHHQTTRNVAADLLNSVEPYGVLVTVGDNDTFPLWYAQEVEGVRRDVTIANTSLLNTDWYARQLIRRPILEYDAAKGPAVYRDKQWTKPSRPPLHMTMDEADAVPAYYELREPMRFSAGPYQATIDPRNLQHGVLERADALVLRMIQDSGTERPIYFARSAAGYPHSLGFENQVLTQGLASKLFVPPPASTKDTVRVEGDGWLDVTRTKTLWDNVFTGHKSTIAEGRWIDRPSSSMPLLYVFTGAELYDALRERGDVRDAMAVLQTSKQVAQAAGQETFVAALDRMAPSPSVGDSAGVTLQLDRNAAPKTQATDPAVVRRRK
jgi:hypothetical protein